MIFGMDTIGKNERETLSPIKNFGYRKLNVIWGAIER